MLSTHPGFTLAAVLSLGLGVGVNSTIFTLVNALLLRPTAVSEPDRLVDVYTSREEIPYLTTSYLDYRDLSAENDVFSGLVAYSLMGVIFSHDAQSEMVLGEIVTGNYFEVLGVEPEVGRTFLPEEVRTPGTHPVAIASYGLWQRRFGGDPSLVGSTIRINGNVFTVVGIAPKTFTGSLPVISPEIWIPVMMEEGIDSWGVSDVDPSPTGDTRLERRGHRWLSVKGRLKPGVTIPQAEAQLQTLFSRLSQEYPETNQDRTIRVLPTSGVRFHPEVDRVLAPAGIVILAVVGMVLLIACANVANMLLARASARRREIAVRMAMGASRGRLLQQLLTESVLLSSLGGALGLILAYWTSDLLLAFQPTGNNTIVLELGLDMRVFLFTLTMSLVSGLVFGLAPAIRASRPDLVPSLKDEARFEGGERRFGFRNLLVIGQVAVSIVLLVGASLMVRSLQSAHEMDLGFRAERLAVMELDLDLHGYSKESGRVFYQNALERLSALPEVASAALVRRLPLTLNTGIEGIYVDGHQQSPDDSAYPIDRTYVGPNYFRTLGVGLLRGRDFHETDTPDGPLVAIINETMAKKYWPQDNPAGRRFRIHSIDGPEVEIVGVCQDYKVRTVGEDPRPYLHFSQTQYDFLHNNIMVQTTGQPAMAVATLRQEMLAMDPNLVFLEANTLPALTRITLIPIEMGAVLMGLFGILGMMLAAVGLYGVIAYSVSRRTHEIGLRLALGANASNVLKMVLKQGMFTGLVGVMIGLAGALPLSHLLSTVLVDVSPMDPLSLCAASVLLLSVALIANYIPARRATRVEPVTALRHD
jgi:predicted permease